jgi:hypothetical protein
MSRSIRAWSVTRRKMLEAPSKSEFDALVAEALADDDALQTATTPRTRNGRRLATDGPFAETKEHLGGSS